MTRSDANPESAGFPSADSHSVLPKIESNNVRLTPGRALEKINQALKVEGGPQGFLPAAENSLLAASDNFTGKLGVESIEIATSRNATAVDRDDVLKANRQLLGDFGTEKRAWTLGVAGLCGGSAITAAVSVLLAPDPVVNAWLWWLIISVLAIVGVALFFQSYPRRGREI